MAEILTSRGDRVVVDDDDYAWLSRWTWRLSPAGYAVATVGGRARQAEDAAMAYDSAAARLLGPDAFLNFMPAPSNGFQGTNDSAEGIRRALAEGAG